MRIRLAIPDRLVTPEALEAALEATALANEQAVIRGEVPHAEEAISAGVLWKPEPYLDGEHFDLAHQVIARGWGDCDDLAPYLAGSMRATGEDPGARPRVYKSGPDRWHVVTETSDGQILDPSKWAGMGRKSGPSVSGVCGVIARPFARLGEGALCCVPQAGRWWSRVDLPFPGGVAGHIASHSRARTPEESLYRAISGAMACGEEIESELTERLRIMGGMLLADTDLEKLNGEGEVGSFFGKLLKPLAKVAKGAVSFIPGVGPIASTALDAASALGKKKKKPAAPAKRSVVRALSKGGGRARPTADTIMHAPTGAVSVPIEAPGSKNPAVLFYHPAGSIGPVVMRF